MLKLFPDQNFMVFWLVLFDSRSGSCIGGLELFGSGRRPYDFGRFSPSHMPASRMLESYNDQELSLSRVVVFDFRSGLEIRGISRS